jgi:hypothetical protein
MCTYQSPLHRRIDAPCTAALANTIIGDQTHSRDRSASTVGLHARHPRFFHLRTHPVDHAAVPSVHCAHVTELRPCASTSHLPTNHAHSITNNRPAPLPQRSCQPCGRSKLSRTIITRLGGPVCGLRSQMTFEHG